MTRLDRVRPLRDITLAALVCLLPGACGDKDGETTASTGEPSTGSAGSTDTTGAATTGPPTHECLDSCGTVIECELDDPSTCPEGQVCVDLGACGCELLVCQKPR